MRGEIKGDWRKTDKKTDKQPRKKAGKTCQDPAPVSSYKYKKLNKNYPNLTY